MSCGVFTEVQFILNHIIPKNLEGVKVLDLGIGFGFYGWALKAHGYQGNPYEAKGFVGTPYVVGVEVNRARAEHTRKFGLYDEVHVLDVTKELPLNEYGVIILSHLIEHLSKEEAFALLARLEKMCTGVIVVACPYGDTTGLEPMSHDFHISAWVERDFEALGYKTRHLRFSHRAGRAVALFEALWYKLRGKRRGGVLVAWKNAKEEKQ